MLKELLFALVAISLVTVPVAAQSPVGFLCDKTTSGGETLSQGDPGYQSADYPPITGLLRTLAWLGLLGIPILCAGIAVYASVADALFTPSGEKADATKYVQLRTGAVFAGIFTPVIILVLDLGLDLILPFHATCMIPTPL